MKHPNFLLTGILSISCLLFFGCAGQRPDNLGVHNGKLTDCPSSPNCVNSQAENERHAIAPFSYNESKEDAFNRLKEIL